jgi:rhodanese-related sulfurtransferase
MVYEVVSRIFLQTTMNHITAEQAALTIAQNSNIVVLDVRTVPEFKHRRISEAINIPLDELLRRYRELDSEKDIVVVCEHGIRSQSATGLLMQLGFERVYNMLGGMSHWTAKTVSG